MLKAMIAATSLLVTGCAGNALVEHEQRQCHARQTQPVALEVSASGGGCRGPDVDGIHVEVQSGDYQVVISSFDGFAAGAHAVKLDTIQGPRRDGMATVLDADGGWMIVIDSAPMVVTLSGD